MKNHLLSLLGLAWALMSCGTFNKEYKVPDYEYRYEAAKAYFGAGQNSKAISLLEDLIPIMKGTANGEESLYLLAMANYGSGDYVSASHYFTTYYTTYPHGSYSELARFYSGRALYMDTPEPRLDQTSTFSAIAELQMFMEYYPRSARAADAQQMIFELQDKLVEKDYLSAKLYYDLGTYTGNASYTADMRINGNNFLACITTAENVLKDYPYTKKREEICILLLRAKYKLGMESVNEKKEERMREAIDEYYSFKNEFPDSKYTKEADKMYAEASKFVTEISEEP